MNAEDGYVLYHFYYNQTSIFKYKTLCKSDTKHFKQNCSKSQKGRIKARSAQIHVCVGYGVE